MLLPPALCAELPALQLLRGADAAVALLRVTLSTSTSGRQAPPSTSALRLASGSERWCTATPADAAVCTAARRAAGGKAWVVRAGTELSAAGKLETFR